MTSNRFTLSDSLFSARAFFGISVLPIFLLYASALFLYEVIQKPDFESILVVCGFFLVTAFCIAVMKRGLEPTVADFENDTLNIQAHGLKSFSVAVHSIKSVSFLQRSNLQFRLENGKKVLLARMLYSPEALPFMQELLHRNPSIDAAEVMRELEKAKAKIAPKGQYSMQITSLTRMVSVVFLVNLVAFILYFTIFPFAVGATVEKLHRFTSCTWAKVFLGTWAACMAACVGTVLLGMFTVSLEDLLYWRRSWADKARAMAQLLMQPKNFTFFYIGIFFVSMLALVARVDSSKPSRNVATSVSASTSSTEVCKK
ncbi:hypothetical protein DOM22_06890 [Bdellovibrio sp. ZAP7]|uniref:hypothetical protein n=1 Tax=Bdellovibrio sp. ZAP7 TaxID=2231053 RepID=UPI0011637B51|nr:hypothetical protein [Bdellovibrio sp. ZAP7]QDK44906.1 hypothetical protein DOM22_06890 [Bdellovibrio sp. ZAP7]